MEDRPISLRLPKSAYDEIARRVQPAEQDCSEVEPCDHDRVKRESDAWALLPYVGVQHLPATDSEPARAYELRNCRSCLSTLAREVA
jgi:hypothetical protein